MGLIAETDVKCGSFEVGATVTATYRNSPYDAKILFIGGKISKFLLSLIRLILHCSI